MNRYVIGILAHVDAGKTTLSEALLYKSGSIRKAGRVDNKDAFLDTHELERARGITIFSKQAVMQFGESSVTLLDTPGHVDFSAEMERTLQVLDYAILVISGADGVQGHTKTLWRLLKKYQIPTFLFINKMDQQGTDKDALLSELQKKLDSGCIDFGTQDVEEFYESVAMCGEESLLEEFLEYDGEFVEGQEHPVITKCVVADLVKTRKVFPCFFGSALKMEGVEELIAGLDKYMVMPSYPESFGAKVFKIARDELGGRLTYMKITGGTLKVKEQIGELQEKVNQIRIYSGEKYSAVNEAEVGCVCAVTGLSQNKPGDGLGVEPDSDLPILEPVLTYQVILPEGCDPMVMLPKLRELEEEDPKLHVVWKEELQEIQVQIMGQVQLEILKSMIRERFGAEVEFSSGNIVYKETIKAPVIGIGHYEPLRHYAEAQLLLEPLKPGSGLKFATACSEDDLDRNWQRLILTHLLEKEHKGVLTGSAITDMKITLMAGRAHLKHTEGGDFRQSTYRAVRHGLKCAESVLLEPVYEFRLEVPEGNIGRAMTDMERMHGTFEAPFSEDGKMVLAGTVPAASLGDYQQEVISYTKGQGNLFCVLKGYAPCHNAEEVIEKMGYDSERDLENPTGSVFCSHGAGFVVNWEEVEDYAHLKVEMPEWDYEAGMWAAESGKLSLQGNADADLTNMEKELEEVYEEEWIGTEEIDSILERTFYANKKSQPRKSNGIVRRTKKEYVPPVTRTYTPSVSKEEYLLVDGYNVIFAWEDLKELAEINIDSAREKLLDVMCNYQGIRNCNLIVVFDAYRVKGHETENLNYHNIHVVYTKEAETADQFIEKFAHENGRKYNVTIATSDRLEQIIIRGQNCHLLSARDLEWEVKNASENLRKEYLEKGTEKINSLEEKLEEIFHEEKVIKK